LSNCHLNSYEAVKWKQSNYIVIILVSWNKLWSSLTTSYKKYHKTSEQNDFSETYFLGSSDINFMVCLPDTEYS